MTRKAAVTKLGVALIAGLLLGQPARAEMILSQVIIDLLPGEPTRGDIEVWNSGDERMYVSAEPFEIRNPGTPEEQRAPAGNPDQSGILVSPQKLILEPGERRLIRIAAVAARPERDRIYRVAIKPVGGRVTASTNALKVFVGYDALVLYRPAQITGAIAVRRDGRSLTLENRGNTAREVFGGRQCDSAASQCRTLPSKRLYSGASWTVTLPYDTPGKFKTAVGADVKEISF